MQPVTTLQCHRVRGAMFMGTSPNVELTRGTDKTFLNTKLIVSAYCTLNATAKLMKARLMKINLVPQL